MRHSEGAVRATTIQRVTTSLPSLSDTPEEELWGVAPIAVAIGPYHHHGSERQVTEAAKRAALKELCRVAKQSPEAIRHKIAPVAISAHRCYAADSNLVVFYEEYDGNHSSDDHGEGGGSGDGTVSGVDDKDGGGDGTVNDTAVGDGKDDGGDGTFSGVDDKDGGGGGGTVNNGDGTVNDDHANDGIIEHHARFLDNNKYSKFIEMMLLDGCFLLQFMVSMCPDDPNAPPDRLMSRPEVHTCIDAIVRDVMLLENQIPWMVLEALMKVRPGVPVDKFLALMASAFDAGNDYENETAAVVVQLDHGDGEQPRRPPPHLLGLFHRRQVGAARTQTLRVPRLSSLSTTAVELAEMGAKLAASKTKKFGDMTMSKRQRGLCLSGELSLAPVVLNDLTSCWLLNMAAYEACLGATEADNFAVGSYVSVVAQLMNREEDVQQLRGKGIINSAMSDMKTMEFFKSTARHLRVGHRYYEVFQGLQEYRQERWAWIAVHRFLYKNYKTMAAVLSIIGVLAGLFKTILSLKQPQH